MIKFGKEIFQDNLTQLTTIIVSLVLAIVAQQLSGDIAHISLTTFLKDGYEVIFSSEQLSILRNVLLPLTMYFLSCACLLWMGLINFVTCIENDYAKSPRFLKILLGFLQLVLFSILIFMEGKLFFYVSLLAFTAILLTGVLHFAFSFQKVQK